MLQKERLETKFPVDKLSGLQLSMNIWCIWLIYSVPVSSSELKMEDFRKFSRLKEQFVGNCTCAVRLTAVKGKLSVFKTLESNYRVRLVQMARGNQNEGQY